MIIYIEYIIPFFVKNLVFDILHAPINLNICVFYIMESKQLVYNTVAKD